MGEGSVSAGLPSAAAEETGFEVETSSSLTSWRNSPSEVNSRRSVTVKLSCFFSAIDSFLELLGWFREGQVRHAGGAPTRLHELAWRCDFAADVAQRHPALTTRQGQGSGAGNFSDLLAFHQDLASRRGQRPVNFKAGEFAAHLAARPDALHDLLANVAAFGKIEGAFLLRFLGQVAFADVGAI